MIRTALTFIQKELENYILNKIKDYNYTSGSIVDLRSVVYTDDKISLLAAGYIIYIACRKMGCNDSTIRL